MNNHPLTSYLVDGTPIQVPQIMLIMLTRNLTSPTSTEPWPAPNLDQPNSGVEEEYLPCRGFVLAQKR